MRMDLAAIGVSREIRNDEDAKGRTNHPAIFKQSYTHHYSIQRLVQLSPSPMPSSSQANVMSVPFDRIQKIRFVQGATMGKGIVAVLRQRPREKFRFVSGSGFFHGRVAHRARVCVCGRTCIVHGGRAALDKSPFDVCLSDFEWNGNRARRKQGGWRNRKYHFSWYRTLRILSCLAFATNFERKGLKCRRDLEWNEKKEKEKCTPF